MYPTHHHHQHFLRPLVHPQPDVGRDEHGDRQNAGQQQEIAGDRGPQHGGDSNSKDF